jgi:hypothetical protein
MANSSLGNIVTRLQGFKNVNPRRVMPGAEFLQQETEDVTPDVSGTASSMPNFSNFIANKPNQPESDLGGELTPQSYDIRANSVTLPNQQEENSGFFSRLGTALADYVNPKKRAEMEERNNAMIRQAREMTQKSVSQTPPIATAQVDAQEGLPPVTASQEEAPKGLWDSLKSEAGKPYNGLGRESIGNAFETTKNYLKDSFTPKLDATVYDRNPNLQKPPELVRQQEQKKELDQAEIESAKMKPWQVTAYGATDAFANSPDLVSDFNTYTGINFDEQMKEQTAKYEKVISDLEKGVMDNDANYDEQERRIKERILNNQSDDADKYYIGLALLMPLLIGGVFGKEAGLGALGGAAKGIADVLGQRQKDIRTDEESLSDIYKQRATNSAKKGELDIEKLKIPSEIQKNLPKDELEDLKGMKIHTFKDQNGKVIGGGPEVLPDLYLDMKYGNTPKKREHMQEKASKLEEEKAALERANAATSDVIKAAMQLKDPGVMSKILAYALSDDDNGALKKLVRQNAPDIVVDGRKVNSAVYIDSKIEQMKDAYRRNEQMKAFTTTVAAHIGNMAENPQYSGLNPKDLIDQMLILRDRGQQFFVDRAGSQGFLKQPLENKFGKLNRQLYSDLNTNAEKKELARDKKLMNASE